MNSGLIFILIFSYFWFIIPILLKLNMNYTLPYLIFKFIKFCFMNAYIMTMIFTILLWCGIFIKFIVKKLSLIMDFDVKLTKSFFMIYLYVFMQIFMVLFYLNYYTSFNFCLDYKIVLSWKMLVFIPGVMGYIVVYNFKEQHFMFSFSFKLNKFIVFFMVLLLSVLIIILYFNTTTLAVIIDCLSDEYEEDYEYEEG